jgi:cytochrome oxidase assembly protein ShyY1
VNRLWKRWIALALFVIVLGVTFVLLGQWQLDRLDQRQDRNATILANEEAAPKPFDQVFAPGVTITDDDQWQRVVATGTFDTDNQFQVRYRFNASQPGYEIVVPLHTTTGQTVLVNRGFISVPTGTEVPSVLPPAPTGQVTVMGHVRRSEHGKPQAIEPRDRMVRLINAPAIEATLPYPVLDGWIATLEMNPAQGEDINPLIVPEISDGPHFWYAMQWFLFAIIGATGLVIFIRSDLRERRGQNNPQSIPAAGADRPTGDGDRPRNVAVPARDHVTADDGAAPAQDLSRDKE